MTKVEFNYKGSITIILCQEDEQMEEICKRYANKTLLDLNNKYFLYNGNSINLQLTYSQIINNIDRERKIMSILVYDLNTTQITNRTSNIINSAFPICPICHENIKLDLLDYKLSLSECKNKHSKIMLVKDFINSQNIDLSKIICNICHRTKSESYNNEMFICNTCHIVLCPLCQTNHEKKHKKINYDLKHNICPSHNETFVSYCKSCNINICVRCQKEHMKHDILLFGEIIPDKDELLDKLLDFRKVLDIFNNDIEDIINKLKDVKNNINLLYQIFYNMVEKYEAKYRNYEILMSLNNVYKNDIIENIRNINTIKDINYKFGNIINMYEKMEKIETIEN